MNILFLCVANSARSQMAEGLARSLFPRSNNVQSAGSIPGGSVNPFAIEAMREADIDISSHFSKSIDEVPQDFLSRLDYVITLCAEEACPVFLSAGATRLKWPFPDPAGVVGSHEETLHAFREVRNQIRQRLMEFRENPGAL